MNMFSYTKRDEVFNAIVDQHVAFAKAELDGKTIENKAQELEKLNFAICKYATENTRVSAFFEKDGLKAMLNPAVQSCRDVQENFDAIVAQIINPLLPIVSNKDMAALFAETRQIGYGDTARFIVKSNELYKVNEIANGVARGVLDPIKNSEFTVNCSPVQIAFEVDFYALAAGVEDIADKAIRVARSFEHYVFLRIIAAINGATSDLGPAYTANGFSTANWSTLAQRVKAANGGSDVLAVGTLAALNGVVPATAGLQYGLGAKIADQGYLDRYLGTRLFCLDQAFAWGQVNTEGKFALSDETIFFVPTGTDRPIKIVYEGNTVVAERDSSHTPDNTYRMAITYRIGVGVVLGSKFAALEL